ncbi:hypothetical protein P3T76_005553 [Phytophthora citrophthora]|uniref:Cadmium resistance transporter n=1 Tax=Phytophthora citrophthora TaxID=4793 RepID=A0AAD9GRN1_9STRA|nr:hypothetical protein P3T76_005553 [Phytophthora citrophthora]
MGIWGLIASAVVMFASTNIDVAIVLVMCFANAAERKDGLKSRHVWIGQFIGFTILVVISLIGAIAGSFLPPHYSGLLGFAPLCMGIIRMKEWCKKDKEAVNDSLDCGNDYRLHSVEYGELNTLENTEETGRGSCSRERSEFRLEEGMNSMSDRSTEGKITDCESSCKEVSTDDTSGVEEGSQSNSFVIYEEDPLNSTGFVEASRPKAWWSAIFSFHVLKMTAVTLSNGGDNVAVYISGLATYTAGEILLTLAIFYLLLVVWLYVTNAFVSIHVMSNFIKKYGIYIIPIALVLLGVYILWSTDVICLVSSSC